MFVFHWSIEKQCPHLTWSPYPSPKISSLPIVSLPIPMLRILIVVFFATRNASSSHRDVNCVLLFTILPKPFGALSFSATHPPLELDPSAMFSYTSTLYAILEQPLTHVTSPPSSTTYSHIGIFGRQLKWWILMKQQTRRGFRPSCLNMVFTP